MLPSPPCFLVSLLAAFLALSLSGSALADSTSLQETASVSAGGDDTCAIRADGELSCWGDDSSGQVSEAPDGEFLSVSAGGAHTCAIRADGELSCWGDDSSGQVSEAPDGEFLSVSAGGAHTCAIRADGELSCWGDDSSGQVSEAPDGEFLSVSAGGAHTCAIRPWHALICWGENSSGQAGGGDIAHHLHKHHNHHHHHHYKDDMPEFLSVAAGGAHTCAIDDDSEVLCWGDDSSGQVSEAPDGEFLSVSAAGADTCAIRADAQLACWGDDFSGQVTETPSGEFLSVSVGGSHNCATGSDGAGACWGDNSNGQVQPRLMSAQTARAVIGTPYIHQFETTPQSPSAEYLVSAGQPPTGLALDGAGALSGEATTAGEFSFTVTASNGVTPDASQDATVNVVGSPLLTIGSATNVTQTSARLGASVNPRNLPAEAWFEYWPANAPADVAATPVTVVPTALTAQAVFAQIGGLSAGTDYVFRLAATNESDPAAVRSETADFTTPQPPVLTVLASPGLAPPTAGQTVNVEPVEGAVGTKCGNDEAFAKLQGAAQIPVGCTIDTRNGTVALTASKGSNGEIQTAYFWGGVFDVDQKAGDNQDAVLTLSGRLKCERRKAGMTSRVFKRGRRGGGRKLWGSGKGNFKTVGNYGSASVRGTTWLVVDRCDNSTLAKVREGTVLVRDFVKKTTVVLREGEQYLAKAPIPRLR